MRHATLCFLLRRDEVCLGMKNPELFGGGKWNGFGGKVGDTEATRDETPDEATRREGKEEFDVDIGEIEKVAEIQFDFPHKPEWDQIVHVYLCRDWQGEPRETPTKEMQPRWFKLSKIPYDSMWVDDKIWLQPALEGRKLRAHFVFDENMEIAFHEMVLIDEIHPPHGKEIGF